MQSGRRCMKMKEDKKGEGNRWGKGKLTKDQEKQHSHRGRCPTGREIRGQNLIEKDPKVN